MWVLDPLEFVFPANESFKHFALKWVDFEQMATRPVEDAALASVCGKSPDFTFQSLGCSGYARCDIRMDAAGELHLLEINPNCGVFYPEESFGSADLILAADPEGHRGFLRHQIEFAATAGEPDSRLGSGLHAGDRFRHVRQLRNRGRRDCGASRGAVDAAGFPGACRPAF